MANEIPVPGATAAASELGPSVPTLFDAMRDAGRPSAAVFGDDHLVGVTGGTAVDYLWPDGVFGDGVAVDVLGYARAGETAVRIREAVTPGAELVVAQLNETDTAGHLFGPDSPEALHRYGRADAHLAELFEWLAAGWGEWVVVVVSDHGQEAVTVPAPIDLHEAIGVGDEGVVVDDGAVAVVGGPMARDVSWLTHTPGVEGVARIDDETVLAWATGGRWLSSIEFPVRGVHGSPRTAPQVAVATGGHPAVARLATALVGSPTSSTWWAPTLAGLLGIASPADSARRVPTPTGRASPPEAPAR